jgi:hypothetical protein
MRKHKVHKVLEIRGCTFLFCFMTIVNPLCTLWLKSKNSILISTAANAAKINFHF